MRSQSPEKYEPTRRRRSPHKPPQAVRRKLGVREFFRHPSDDLGVKLCLTLLVNEPNGQA